MISDFLTFTLRAASQTSNAAEDAALILGYLVNVKNI